MDINMVKLRLKPFLQQELQLRPPWCPPSPVGLYKVTKHTICGSSIGATPQNDVTYFPVFTPSSEVPVFPPTLKPSTLFLKYL